MWARSGQAQFAVLASKERSTGNEILRGDLITGEDNCEVLQNINQWLNASN